MFCVNARGDEADLALDRLTGRELHRSGRAFLDERELGVGQFGVEFDEAVARNTEIGRAAAPLEISPGRMARWSTMPPTGRAGVMRDWRTFISLTDACEDIERALRAGRFHAALFKQLLRECAFLLRAISARASWLFLKSRLAFCVASVASACAICACSSVSSSLASAWPCFTQSPSST